MLRLAVVGVGHLGWFHASLVKGSNFAELAGVFDIDTHRCNDVARRLGVSAYESLDTLLSDVDAVIIATPTGTHFDIGMAAVRAGKHILMEKPLTDSYEKAVHLVEKAESCNLVLALGYTERFNPAYRSAKPFIKEPAYMESERLTPPSERGTDVSVILDLMIHDIDLALDIFGCEPLSVSSYGVNVVYEKDDISSATLFFTGDRIAKLTASRVSLKPTRKLHIFQSESYLSLDLAKRSVNLASLRDISSPGVECHSIPFGKTNRKIFVSNLPVPDDVNPLLEEIRDFVAAVETGKKPAVSGREALRSLKISFEIISNIQRPKL
ncbi:MAG: hypothetical protein B6D65_04625 [candidate division Zixibacteria bacterium 4484_93]|nr:MAG: hypothetical protein B6D65_04625 [candidate division Zixibacteria bacterium 4484_93]